MQQARETIVNTGTSLPSFPLSLAQLEFQKDAGRAVMRRADETIGALGQLPYMDIAQGLVFEVPLLILPASVHFKMGAVTMCPLSVPFLVKQDALLWILAA